MDRINILDILRKSKKYDIALMTTFNFEIGFFERNVLNKLFDNGIRKVSLFVDNKEYLKAIEETELSYIGKRYIVTPVVMNSSFHPKVILLLGKTKARIIVGSWNLTTNGYFINNEVGNCFDYDENHPENLSLIKNTIDFFLEINNNTDKRDSRLIESITNYPYYSLNNDVLNDTYFLSNMTESIINQVKNKIEEEVNTIDIAVPYFDNELTGLKYIEELYPKSKINLFIQNERNTFPEKYVNNYSINLYNYFSDNKSYRFYHGKVIRFNTDKHSYILYGSTNCTQAALKKSFIDSGNVECDILTRGYVNEYDYFFDNFVIEEKIEFKSKLLSIKPVESTHYSYIINDLNVLKFKYKNINDDLKIYVFNNEVQYKYEDDNLLVTMPIELFNDATGIFNVDFKFNDNMESIRCYINDIEEVERNRNLEIINKIPNINISPDIDAESDIYLKDRINLISQFRFMYDIFNEKLDYYIKEDETEDSEITDEKEDFIDYDFKLSDDVQMKQNKLDQIFKANNHIYHSFRSHLISLENKCSNRTYDSKDGEKKKNNKSDRRYATSNEKSFARMVKGIVKDMLNKTNCNKLDFINYLKCVVSLFDVYNKFLIRENVIDMFNEKEVIENEFNLINELTSKFEYDIDEEAKDMYLWLSIACALQTNYINLLSNKVDYKKNLSNRDLFKKIDERFKIRDDYKKYLTISLNYINEAEQKIDLLSATSYIESLFDYKTDSQIENLMNKNFGDDYTVNFDNSMLLITINADNIGKYLKLNDIVIKEIIKNYNKKEEFKAIRIIVNNVNINMEYQNPPIKIEYLFNRSGKGHQIITPKIGSPREPKKYNIKMF